MIYYAIGDIHGWIDRLEDILDQIDYGLDGKIVFLGDYSSRGKKSKQVIEKVRQVVVRNKAIALKGNHDDQMVRCYRHPNELDNVYWIQNYLKKTKKSYWDKGFFDVISYRSHVDFLETLPKTYESDRFFFSHSGDPTDYLWGRPEVSQRINNKINVHGHTPRTDLLITENEINVDTGCAWTLGKLTCVRLDDHSGKITDVFESRGNQ
jgi:serine/threonine protein phosphatase 1